MCEHTLEVDIYVKGELYPHLISRVPSCACVFSSTVITPNGLICSLLKKNPNLLALLVPLLCIPPVLLMFICFYTRIPHLANSQREPCSCLEQWSLITQCVQVCGTATIALFGPPPPQVIQITFHTIPFLRSAVNPQPKSFLYRLVFPNLLHN